MHSISNFAQDFSNITQIKHRGRCRENFGDLEKRGEILPWSQKFALTQQETVLFKGFFQLDSIGFSLVLKRTSNHGAPSSSVSGRSARTESTWVFGWFRMRKSASPSRKPPDHQVACGQSSATPSSTARAARRRHAPADPGWGASRNRRADPRGADGSSESGRPPGASARGHVGVRAPRLLAQLPVQRACRAGMVGHRSR